MSASVGAFCTWANPIAFLFAGIGAVVFAIGIHADDRAITLTSVSVFMVSSLVAVVCFWRVLG